MRIEVIWMGLEFGNLSNKKFLVVKSFQQGSIDPLAQQMGQKMETFYIN
jgi:hypothetical protein